MFYFSLVNRSNVFLLYILTKDLCFVAAKRPPVEEILQFLDNEKAWIIPRLFGNKPIRDISEAIAGRISIFNRAILL